MNKNTAEASVAPVTGGATIADRFKLDMTDPNAKKSSGGGAFGTVSAVAGLIALAAVGILTYMLWQHWAYLMPA